MTILFEIPKIIMLNKYPLMIMIDFFSISLKEFYFFLQNNLSKNFDPKKIHF